MSDNKQFSGILRIQHVGGTITFTFEIANEDELRRLTALCEELHKGSNGTAKPKRVVKAASKQDSNAKANHARQTQPKKSREDTYKEILIEVKKVVGDKEYSKLQADRIAAKATGYGESTVRDSIRWAINRGQLFLVSENPHIYSFVEPAERGISNKGLVDLIANKWPGLIEALKVIERISPALVLMVSAKGIHGRTSDLEKSSVIDLAIAPQLFTTYRVQKPVTFGVDVKGMLDRLGTLKKGERLHLALGSLESNSLNVGASGREFDFSVQDLIPATNSFDSLTLPEQKAELVMKREAFATLLKDAAVNGPYIDMIHEEEKTVFSNVSTSGDFRREARSICVQPCRSRYLIDTLLKCVRGQSSCEIIVLKDYLDMLTIDLKFQEHISLRVMVASVRNASPEIADEEPVNKSQS
jgi:hypothetical protein